MDFVNYKYRAEFSAQNPSSVVINEGVVFVLDGDAK